DRLPQDLRVEETLHAEPDPRRLVGIGRSDAAPGRPDLQLPEPALARLVDRDVPRHDEVRVPREPDDVRRNPARLQLVDLREEHFRVDDAPSAEHALLAGDHAARDLADLDGLAPRDDPVAGGRAAVARA